MNNIIRWKGLLTAAILTAVIAASSFLFLDTGLRYATIQGLQKVTGAEVNLDKVVIS